MSKEKPISLHTSQETQLQLIQPVKPLGETVLTVEERVNFTFRERNNYKDSEGEVSRTKYNELLCKAQDAHTRKKRDEYWLSRLKEIIKTNSVWVSHDGVKTLSEFIAGIEAELEKLNINKGENNDNDKE